MTGVKPAVTFFADYAATEKREEVIAIDELAELIRRTSAPVKDKLPWLKLSRFGNARTGKGSLRHNRNLIAVSGIEADYDGCLVNFDEAVETSEKAGLLAIVYTSPSHCPERPRWRILCPTSKELPPAQRAHLVGRLNGLYHGIFAAESWTISQSYYYGSVNNNPAHQVAVIDGHSIDELDELDEIWIGKPATKFAGNGADTTQGPVDEEMLIEQIRTGASYHTPAIRLLGTWANRGVSLIEARKRLTGAFDAVDAASRDGRWHARVRAIPDMLGYVWGKEAEERDAQEAEIISVDTMRAAADALTRQSTAADIDAIITQLAAAKFSPIDEANVVEAIRQHSGQTKKVIEDTLKGGKRKCRTVVSRTRGWVEKCILLYNGDPKTILTNIALAFREDPEWQGVLALNQFTGWITLRAAPPWIDKTMFKERPWTDADERQATIWLQNAGIHARSKDVFEAIATVAEENSFHPVREHLDSLVWDGTPRLDDWLVRYLGVHSENPPAADDELKHWKKVHRYVETVGPRFMISAVARIYKPGFKADCVLILIGPQGSLKSTALRVLFEPWFTDEISDFGSKDAAMQMRGVWLVELAELDSMSRSAISRTKAFISRTTDRFRPPYGRQVIDSPRQNVFAGSTNEDEIFRDPTGNRRLWPAIPNCIDITELKRDRDQIWAEAVHRFRDDEKSWIDEPDLIEAAEMVQAEHQESDAWDPAISEYLKRLTEPQRGVTTADILSGALVITDRAKWGRAEQMRVGACLRRRGWMPRQMGTVAEAGIRRYFPPKKAAQTVPDITT